MSDVAAAGGLRVGDRLDAPARTSVSRVDWLVAGLAVWLVSGFYVDLWAHSHGIVDDTFITPWHGLLYSGASSFIVVLLLIGAVRLLPDAGVRRAVTGYARAVVRRPRQSPTALRALVRAVPDGYRISLVGSVLFVLAGGVDLVWHSVFGFELDVEILLSPPHLVLATSGVLMAAGPLRSVWHRDDEHLAPGWLGQGPVVISLLMIFAVFAAFTQYAHPLVEPWGGSTRAAVLDDLPRDLWAMDPDGSEQRRLTISEADEAMPAAGPAGSDGLAWTTLTVDGPTLAMGDPTTGGTVTRATAVAGAKPVVSPDGTVVVFERETDAGRSDIAVMAVEGGAIRDLTSDPADDWNPAWSPDGATIAFTTERNGDADVAIVDLASGTERVLRRPGTSELDPAFSADGTRLLVAVAAGADLEIWSLALDGSDPRQLTDARNTSRAPAVAADGRIAFVTDRDGDLEVYAMTASGEDEMNLTRSPATDDGRDGIAWTRDGSTIVYPSAPPPPFWRSDYVRDGWGAAAVLVHSALVGGFALVALRRRSVPVGTIALLVAVPTLMMAPIVEEWRFVPGAVVAGIAAEAIARGLGFGRSRARDVLIAASIPALWFGAYFVTLAVTEGIGWPFTMVSGSIVLAAVVGALLNEVSRSGLGRSAHGL